MSSNTSRFPRRREEEELKGVDFLFDRRWNLARRIFGAKQISKAEKDDLNENLLS